jgi:anti-sigma B factor antagonist
MSTSPQTGPRLEVRRHGERTVVRFPGCDRLDESNSEAVGLELSRLADDLDCPHLVLDFGGIRYLTSTTLGTLVSLNRKARSEGGRLALCNVGPEVAEVLAVTRLDSLLAVERAAEGLRA